MTKSKQKKAQRIVEILEARGKRGLARQLVEAFNLNDGLRRNRLHTIEPDEGLAEIDDEDLALNTKKLERYIPVSASLPEIDEEKSLNFDPRKFRGR